MQRARFSRLTLDGFLPAGKRARISRLSVDGSVAAGVTKRARISRLVMDGVFPVKRARISQLQLTGSVGQPLMPFLTTVTEPVEAGTLVTVSAAATTGAGVSTAWEITSGGAGVQLVGTGLVQALVAPYDPGGRVITIQVDYLDAYGVTGTRTVTIEVRPHQFWFCREGDVLIPVTHPFLRI